MIARFLRFVVAIELLAAAALASWLHAVRDWDAALAIGAGIGAPLGVHAGIIAINFGLAWHAGSPTPAEHRLGPLRALATYLREFLDSFLVFQLALPWAAPRPLDGEAATESSGVPVLLIHGYVCNRQLWRPLARWLAARGHAIDAVARLRQRTGADRVALVCHSMGGLAARAYLRTFGAQAVACVVTLGTPHRGTFHTGLGQGANARQMRLDSEWLRTLAQGESAELRQRFTILLSHHDNIVAPQAIQRLPDARVLEYSGLGHLTLAFDHGVWHAVADALQKAPGWSTQSTS
jgi:predicted alpha/beta hydrolase family esterase